jgi:hypothetical protein
MATSGVDAKLKIWDLRTYQCLNEHRTLSNGAATLAFSQKKLLAASYRDVVEVKLITSISTVDFNRLIVSLVCSIGSFYCFIGLQRSIGY